MNDFCGVFTDARNEINIQEISRAFDAFNAFSSRAYPIFAFFSKVADKNKIKLLKLKYPNLRPILINTINSLPAYSYFMVEHCFTIIPEEFDRCLCFQGDGYLRKRGWEDFVSGNDFDYIGAAWPEKIEFNPGLQPQNIGNGGFSFRKRDKMLAVLNLIKEKNIKIDYEKIPEDVVYSAIGFNFGVFKSISVEKANLFSVENWNGEDSFGFHRKKKI